MSELINGAILALKDRLKGGFDGVARFAIEDEGSIMIDETGVREGVEEAEVTLSASAGTFRSILEGDLDAVSAFMRGDLKVDGDMGTAMRLGSALS